MTEEEKNYVEIEDEDGEVTKCAVYDLVDFEEKTYALLLPLNEDGSEDEEAELILLEYIEQGEDSFFQSIEDDGEFERVSEYIDSLEYDEDEE